MSDQDKRFEILRKLENSELSAEDGLRNLRELEVARENIAKDQPVVVNAVGYTASRPTASESLIPTKPPTTPRRENQMVGDDHKESAPEHQHADELSHWKRWWMLPFWVGVAITIAGAGLVFWGYTATYFGWGFWLAWLPFSFGLLVMVLSWQSQKSRWLHIRIRQKLGQKPGLIVVSIPLPLKFAAWLIRHFGPFIPNLRDKGLDEIIIALEQTVSPEAPFYVNVEGKDGEHVEVFIG